MNTKGLSPGAANGKKHPHTRINPIIINLQTQRSTLPTSTPSKLTSPSPSPKTPEPEPQASTLVLHPFRHPPPPTPCRRLTVPPTCATAADTNTRAHRRPKHLYEKPLPHKRLIHTVLCLLRTGDAWVTVVDESWIAVIQGCFITTTVVEDCDIPNALLGTNDFHARCHSPPLKEARRFGPECLHSKFANFMCFHHST